VRPLDLGFKQREADVLDE